MATAVAHVGGSGAARAGDGGGDEFDGPPLRGYDGGPACQAVERCPN